MADSQSPTAPGGGNLFGSGFAGLGDVPMSNVLRISEAASLAMHAMAMLSENPDKRLSTKVIAARLQVSEFHLSKVLQRLVKAGMIRSIRGPKGGFCLNRETADVSLLEVYEAIEGSLGPSKCLLGHPVCVGERCILGGFIEKVNTELRDYLQTTRLADLAGVYPQDSP